jgi:two-component system alkaline phosphatase synthesis response regulator PhoP
MPETKAIPRILLVEDDVDLADSIRENLEAYGYEIEVVGEGSRALDSAREAEFHLIVLDVILPGMDGFTVCRELRESGNNVPILFLTARDAPEDRIHGLEEGGDDYLPKPFELREFLLRVDALLRRRLWRTGESVESIVIRFGGNEVDLRTYNGRAWDGAAHLLDHKEAAMLSLLADREGDTVTREEIADAVWGHEVRPSSRALEELVRRLRRRFEPRPEAPLHLHRVGSLGYRFTSEPEEQT